MANLEIRRGTLADLPVLVEIYNEAIKTRMSTCDEEPMTIEQRQGWFAQFSDKHPLYVGEVSGKVVSYSCIFPYNTKSGFRFAVENSVYVREDFKGQGFGKVMLSHIIGEAKKLGYSYIHASIFKHNEPSIKLHLSLGYRLLGTQERVAYMDGKWMDNCLLCINL